MDEVSRALPELLWLDRMTMHANTIEPARAGLQHQRRRQLHREPRQGRPSSRSRCLQRHQRSRPAAADLRLRDHLQLLVHEAAAAGGRAPAARRHDRRRPPPAAADAHADREERRRWRSRPDSKASPGTSASLAGLVAAARPGRRLVLVTFKGPMKEQIAGAGRKLAELQVKIQEGRAAKQKLPQFREEVRRLELELDKLLRILPARRNTPGAAAAHPRADRAGRLRPPALHARQLHRPATSTASGRSRSRSTARTTTWRCSSTASAGSRASSTSRTCKVTALAAQREAGTRSPPTFIAKTFVYKETPPPEPRRRPRPAGAASSESGQMRR